MELENPLLLPRMVWQIALAVTTVLVVIKVGLHLRAKRKAQLAAALAPEGETKEGENSQTENIHQG
jgi:hypothetical protein